MKLALAALDLKIFGKDWLTYDGDDDGIFCTQLVVMLLQYCGLFGSEYCAKEYEPDDFRDDFSDDELDLLNCKLGKEIRIK